MTPALVEEIAPNCCRAIKESMLSLNNPLQTLRRIHELIGQLVQQLEVLMEQAEIEVLRYWQYQPLLSLLLLLSPLSPPSLLSLLS